MVVSSPGSFRCEVWSSKGPRLVLEKAWGFLSKSGRDVELKLKFSKLWLDGSTVESCRRLSKNQWRTIVDDGVEVEKKWEGVGKMRFKCRTRFGVQWTLFGLVAPQRRGEQEEEEKKPGELRDKKQWPSLRSQQRKELFWQKEKRWSGYPKSWWGLRDWEKRFLFPFLGDVLEGGSGGSLLSFLTSISQLLLG